MCLELTEESSYRKLIESDLLQISLMCIYQTAAQKDLPSLSNSLTQAYTLVNSFESIFLGLSGVCLLTSYNAEVEFLRNYCLKLGKWFLVSE